MDLAIFEQIVQSPFSWSILCLIAVSIYYRNNQTSLNRLQNQADAREKAITKLYEDHKKESARREERLMSHLEKTTETLENIEHNLTNLENKIDGGFSEVWDHIQSLKKS